MDPVNASLLVLGFLTASIGLFGDKVAKEDGRAFIARIRIPGWFFIALIIATLALGLHKERNSFEGQIRKVYPDFHTIVEQETTHSETDWTRYMSYRISLRFLTQRLYRLVKGNNPSPAASLKSLLKEMGSAGALDNNLCKDLDYIRWHTFRSEWGLGSGGTRDDLRRVDEIVPQALATLQKLTVSTVRDSLSPNPHSICGQDPGNG